MDSRIKELYTAICKLPKIKIFDDVSVTKESAVFMDRLGNSTTRGITTITLKHKDTTHVQVFGNPNYRPLPAPPIPIAMVRLYGNIMSPRWKKVIIKQSARDILGRYTIDITAIDSLEGYDSTYSLEHNYTRIRKYMES